MTINTMTILNETLRLDHDLIEIDRLKFLKENPRVYSCTYGESDFSTKDNEEQQKIIFEKLQKEPSVKNLKPEIKRHGGLMESILIRYDTMEVIEGNSRLAVYRMLNDANEEGNWEQIPCYVVSKLSEEQQAAYLNQIHVKGKTQWSAYEKANFAYVRKAGKMKFEEIADLFGESPGTIRHRVKSIELMKENKDNEQQHFSYYDVLVRNKTISDEMNKAGGLKGLLLDIKNLGSDEETNTFTAQDLRNKLPVVLKKRKVLKKYIDRKISLDEAYQRAKISDVEENIKQATALLEDVSGKKIAKLEKGSLNAFKQATRKLSREVKRITEMTDASMTKND